MKKRRFALMMVMVLLLGLLSGCGKKEQELPVNSDVITDSTEEKQTEEDNASDKEDENVDASVEGNETEDTWSWPLEQKEELSIWMIWISSFQESPDEIITVQMLEEQTNVHIDWITVSKREATEKFGLMMASGDYPDIIRQADDYYTGGLTQAVADGVVLDLTEYVPEYMPNYSALRESNDRIRKDTVTDDGRLIGLYGIANSYGEIKGEDVYMGLTIRQDWLDELQMEKPVTVEDWDAVLRAFKENYDCEAPLLVGANGYDMSHDFLSAYGVLGEFYMDGDVVKYGPAEEGYRQWLELFRGWYEEGLIDPNFVSNDASMSSPADYIATGRSGAGSSAWSSTADYYKENGFTEDEDFFLAAVKTPVLKEGDTPQIGYDTSSITVKPAVVTSNCENVELACRWLDLWYDHDVMMMLSMGIEGESYIDNGDGTYSLGPALYKMVEDGTVPSIMDAMLNYKITGFGLYNWSVNRFVLSDDNAMADSYDTWTGAQFDMIIPSTVTMTEEESVAFNNKYTAIKTLVQENTVKFITGAQSMDQYDTFVEQLYEYGLEECIAYKQAALDRYNNR